MRLLSSLILKGLLLQQATSVAFPWQSIFLSRSRIPTFILDLNHPWIQENRKLLERLDDPSSALCSLNSTIRLGLHDHAVPPDLYKYLEIDNNKAGVDRPGWKNARMRLQEIRACPAALRDVEHFKVDIWVSDGRYGIGKAEPKKPPQDLPEIFMLVLREMTRLQELEWCTFDNGNAEFQHAFDEAGLKLPSVRKLTPAASAVFLAKSCPNVQDLRSEWSLGRSYLRWAPHNDPRWQFVESTSHLDHLTTFGMEGDWKIELLTGMLLCDSDPPLTGLKHYWTQTQV